MGRLALLLKKELIQLVKNPKMRITLFVPPILQLIVLGYAATLELKRVDVAFLDYSRSAPSRAFVAEFSGSPTFRVQAPLADPSDLRRRVDERKIQVAIIVPDAFERDLKRGRRPDVQVVVDGRSANSGALAGAYVRRIVSRFSLNESPKTRGVEITTRAWHNPNFDARLFMAPAILALIALIDVMLLNALAIAKEREEGTFDQLRLTPVSTLQILVAKGLSSIVVGSIQLTVGLIVVRYWFAVPLRSSFWTLAALLGAFLFAATGLGLLVSVLSKNLQQAILGAFGLILPCSMLSGLTTPVESMTPLFQTLTLANPLRAGVDAIPRCFLEGATFADLRFDFALLGTIAVVSFALAEYAFARRRKFG